MQAEIVKFLIQLNKRKYRFRSKNVPTYKSVRMQLLDIPHQSSLNPIILVTQMATVQSVRSKEKPSESNAHSARPFICTIGRQSEKCPKHRMRSSSNVDTRIWNCFCTAIRFLFDSCLRIAEVPIKSRVNIFALFIFQSESPFKRIHKINENYTTIYAERLSVFTGSSTE